MARGGNRPDAPKLRNLKRGSAVDAIAAVQLNGAASIIDELMQDRLARTGVGPAASLLATWHNFHAIAFQRASPPVPVLPLTARSLMILAAMFKKGGTGPFRTISPP